MLSQKIWISDLQNKINDYFKNNPHLYNIYLSQGNEDLRVFCLANLFKQCDTLYQEYTKNGYKEEEHEQYQKKAKFNQKNLSSGK